MKPILLIVYLMLFHLSVFADDKFVFEAGHSSLQGWLLPDRPAYPEGNELNAERVELGKKLFFDVRLSGDKSMSCGTCHNPMLGWSDGLPTAKGINNVVLARATPTIINTGYNKIHMWDGRKKSLEDQAMGPMQAKLEMNTDIEGLFKWLKGTSGYVPLFDKAYPSEGINEDTVSKAIASFERTVISNNSPFDKWIKGNKHAMTPSQVNGFRLFINKDKGNCAVCHSAPNFTDDGFHNLGLASFTKEEPDVGRFSNRPLKLMKGAFKTPTLRDINLTAPYFHDGSAKTLDEVIEHYIQGGVVKTNLSPNFKKSVLTKIEKENILLFLKALTTKQAPLVLPIEPIGPMANL